MSHAPPVPKICPQPIGVNAFQSSENILSSLPSQKSMAESKSRYLRIRVINVSAQHSLELETSKFYSGGFDHTPVEPVLSGNCSTFWVCNLKMAEGACGGLIYRVRSLGSGQVCGHVYVTFSNPFVGNIKCSVKHDTELNFDIGKITRMYDAMNQVNKEIKNAHVCCFQEKSDEKHLVVLFKDAHQVWE